MVLERCLALIDLTADGRGCGRLRRAGERNMALAGEQSRGGIEPDPAGAGQIHLAPGMQVGKIRLRSDRSIERLYVGHQLNEVAGNETRREAHVAHQLHQQGSGIAARARALRQRFLRQLHTRFEADHVLDVVSEALIDTDDEINGAATFARNAGQIARDGRRCRGLHQIRYQFAALVRIVLEGKLLRVRCEEEIERVEHRHLDDQINFDSKLAGRFRKYQSRQVVRLGVLLPIDEMLRRAHLE